MHILSVIIGAALVMSAAPGSPIRAEFDPVDLVARIERTALDADQAVNVEGVTVQTAIGSLRISSGVIFPATAVADSPVELVFLGEARLEVAPPDAIETEQLALFTGAGEISESISAAVLVVCHDPTRRALLSLSPAGNVDAELRDQATRLFEAWKTGPERRLLDVETALLLDAMGDPLYDEFFAGQFEGAQLGRFLMQLSPDAEEQLTLGQFVQIEASEKEERRARRRLERAQRRGRAMGLEYEDLGVWDTWVSASLRDAAGSDAPGKAGFEPRHYRLDVTVGDDGTALRGSARIRLEAQTGRALAVRLSMDSSLALDAARDADGNALFFAQSGGDAAVLLERIPAAGETIEIEVEFHGVVLGRVRAKVYGLLNTTHWYPHAGTVDRAPYEATLRWPGKFELIAAGRRVESGTEGKLRWERREMKHATAAFSFELGEFEIETFRVGDVVVRVAFDRYSYEEGSEPVREAVSATVKDALEFYEQTFGDYPLDYLTVVSAPRDFAQGLLGFVTLPSTLMFDYGQLGDLLGLTDPRSIVAHELAHQWWGNLVGWSSYRDQWISEAMANYSAVVWARRRLPKEEQPTVGPTSGWEDLLLSETKQGRPVESLGPLVLGGRLDSSHSSRAYAAIVYKKGAVVLNMLQYGLGEEAFLKMLKQLVLVAGDSRISTADFITVLERLSGHELQWFADQYIYSTGLPEVYYRYTFEPHENGKWGVRLNLQQQVAYHYEFDVVAAADGGFDIRRRAIVRGEAGESALAVPVQIAVFDPALAGKKARKRKGSVEPNSTVLGRILIDKPEFEMEFEIAMEPTELWIDRERSTFARFWSEERWPKRMLTYHGLDSAAAGRLEEAEAHFEQALQAAVDDDDKGGVAEKAQSRFLDAWIQVNLARLYLDAGRIGEARAAVDAADAIRGVGASLNESIRLLRCRLDLHDGNYAAVIDRLRKSTRGEDPDGRTEGYLLLAIAARAAGEDELFERSATLAEKQGADLAPLRE